MHNAVVAGVCGQLPFIIDDWALGAGQAKSEVHSSTNKMIMISEQVIVSKYKNVVGLVVINNNNVNLCY